MKKRLEYVLGNKGRPAPVDESLEDESEGRGSVEELVTAATTAKESAPSDEEDDALAYFAKLAN